MNRVNTLRELFTHHEWLGQKLLDATGTLSDEQLDRAVEMGFGSLRKTLWHIYAAEHVWMQRVHHEPVTPFNPEEANRTSVTDLRERIKLTRQRREQLLGSIGEADFDHELPYTDMKGNPHQNRLGDILLHVYNHAVHHGAQALNMLRHSDGIAKLPRTDYIFMYLERPELPPPRLSVEVLTDYFAYTDWARDRVLDAALQLDAQRLDRPFEMGCGSIRKNLVHIHDAETWWLRNWNSKMEPFPKLDETIDLHELRERFEHTARSRNEFLHDLQDEDLPRRVEGQPAPGRMVHFALGVTMMQLCFHATHHRAQTINMLRHSETAAPPTDYILFKREVASRGSG